MTTISWWPRMAGHSGFSMTSRPFARLRPVRLRPTNCSCPSPRSAGDGTATSTEHRQACLPKSQPGRNPPDGAIIDYFHLAPSSTAPVTLEIFDNAGKLIRRYASTDQPAPIEEKQINVPLYWLRPHQTLAATPGMHRFIWDLRYEPPKVLRHDYPIAAIYKDTPPRATRNLGSAG